VPDAWFDRMDGGRADTSDRQSAPAAAAVTTATATAPRTTPVPDQRDLSFPLFAPEDDVDDEPLIKLPAAPRPPLAVRRTPDTPRLRPYGQPLEQNDGRLALETSEIALGRVHDDIEPITVDRTSEPAVSGIARRAAAGVIDLALLAGIDFVVVYSTLRMSGLTFSDWTLLPAVPLLAFLFLLKLSYFGGFTAACGQTIGKMAMRIRVVADHVPLDPGRAARRTLVSAISFLAVGTGFIPVFVDPDHRALHDRVAGTRVVELPSI
jgi:uncharacterized RDD family membrane protein YckC